MVWRCATRVEKGKERCFDSPTLKEEWIKEVLEKVTCENNVYSEEMVGSKVEKIVIFNEYLGVCCKDKDKISIKLISSR